MCYLSILILLIIAFYKIVATKTGKKGNLRMET